MNTDVLIIGAGPAGLTAAYTLLNESSEYHPIIIEASEFIGGISRTARYNGNRKSASAPPQQPGKRAKQPPPAGWQVGVAIFILH